MSTNDTITTHLREATTTGRVVHLTTAQALTLGTGRLVCPITDLYAALNQITGDNLYTHQLPRAGRWVEPYIHAALSWTDQEHRAQEYLDNHHPEEAMSLWAEDVSAAHGETHQVPYLGAYWKPQDPITELHNLMNHPTPGDNE